MAPPLWSVLVGAGLLIFSLPFLIHLMAWSIVLAILGGGLVWHYTAGRVLAVRTDRAVNARGMCVHPGCVRPRARGEFCRGHVA